MWTVLTHNSSAPVTVQGSSLHKPHIMKFNYSTSAEQLRAIVSGSEQCQQEVVYHCKKSRLFNTKGQFYFPPNVKRALSCSIYDIKSLFYAKRNCNTRGEWTKAEMEIRIFIFSNEEISLQASQVRFYMMGWVSWSLSYIYF